MAIEYVDPSEIEDDATIAGAPSSGTAGGLAGIDADLARSIASLEEQAARLSALNDRLFGSTAAEPSGDDGQCDADAGLIVAIGGRANALEQAVARIEKELRALESLI